MKTKDQIRSEMRKRRREVNEEERLNASELVCAAILARADVRAQIANRRPFAVYLASKEEIDLSSLIEALWAKDITVAVPCWNQAQKCYRLGVYDNMTSLVEGLHRIPEPAEVNHVDEADIGVWIVPGLAFTRGGGRIGYGGGWYDRLLIKAAPEAIKLGVAYEFQFVDMIPAELHDKDLTDVVSSG